MPLQGFHGRGSHTCCECNKHGNSGHSSVSEHIANLCRHNVNIQHPNSTLKLRCRPNAKKYFGSKAFFDQILTITVILNGFVLKRKKGVGSHTYSIQFTHSRNIAVVTVESREHLQGTAILQDRSGRTPSILPSRNFSGFWE